MAKDEEEDHIGKREASAEHTVSNDRSVNHKCQQRHLVCAGVVHQQRGSIIITDGDIGRSLRGGQRRQRRSDS